MERAIRREGFWEWTGRRRRTRGLRRVGRHRRRRRCRRPGRWPRNRRVSRRQPPCYRPRGLGRLAPASEARGRRRSGSVRRQLAPRRMRTRRLTQNGGAGDHATAYGVRRAARTTTPQESGGCGPRPAPRAARSRSRRVPSAAYGAAGRAARRAITISIASTTTTSTVTTTTKTNTIYSDYY